MKLWARRPRLRRGFALRGDVDDLELIMRRQRSAYRRGLLITALSRGTWPEDVPVPADLLKHPIVVPHSA